MNVVSLKQRGHGIGAQAEAGAGDGIQSEGAIAKDEAAGPSCRRRALQRHRALR